MRLAFVVAAATTDPAPADLRLTVYRGVDHAAWGPTYDLSAGHDVYACCFGTGTTERSTATPPAA